MNATRQNTEATLKATRETTTLQLDAARKREHESWVRDRKQEVYLDYLNAISSILTKVDIMEAGWDPTIKSEVQSLRVLRTQLNLVGSARVRVVASDLENESGVAFAINSFALDTNQDHEALVSRVKDYMQKTGHIDALLARYIELARKDLGFVDDEDGIFEPPRAAVSPRSVLQAESKSRPTVS